MSDQMRVTLELYCDQSHLVDESEGELIWELYVNGSPFPHENHNILETGQINNIVRTLVDLEEERSD